MRKYGYLLLCLSAFLGSLQVSAQFTYKIKADSVKITNDNCNAELIIENSTKNISGYLFNYGNGRTRFQSLDGLYQPLENQRLSTGNSPSFTNQLLTGGLLHFMNGANDIIVDGSDPGTTRSHYIKFRSQTADKGVGLQTLPGGVGNNVPYEFDFCTAPDGSASLLLLGDGPRQVHTIASLGASGTAWPIVFEVNAGTDPTDHQYDVLRLLANRTVQFPQLGAGYLVTDASGIVSVAPASNNSSLWNGYSNSFGSGVQSGGITSIIGFQNDGSAYSFSSTALANWLGINNGGETLQSVTTRSNTTTTSINAAGGYITTATEGLRIVQDNGYISGYNTAGSARSGYLQFGPTATGLASENGATLILRTNNQDRLTIDNLGNFIINNNTTSKYIVSNTYGGAIRFAANSTTSGDRGVQLGHVDNAGSFYSSLIVDGDNGNIGIGTTNTTDRVSVLMPGSSNGRGVTVRAVNGTGAGSQPGFAYENNNSSKRFYTMLDVNSDTWNLANANGINLITANQSNGSVSFGTPNGFSTLALLQSTGNSWALSSRSSGESNEFKLLYLDPAGNILSTALSAATTGGINIPKTDGNGGINITNGNDVDLQLGITVPGAGTKYGWIQSSVSNRNLVLNPTNGGNVGIGTVSPAYKLDVNGAARFASSVEAASIITGDYSPPINGASYANGNFMAYTSASNLAAGGRPGIGFHASGSYGLYLYANGATDLRIRSMDNNDYQVYHSGNFTPSNYYLASNPSGYITSATLANYPSRTSASTGALAKFDASNNLTSSIVWDVNGTNIGLGVGTPFASSRVTIKGLGTSASTAAFVTWNSGAITTSTLDDAGNFYAAGDIVAFATSFSDRRLKTNISPIHSALSIIDKLQGYTFDWKSTGKHDVGLIAQEVEQVLPELISEHTQLNDASHTRYKTVTYDKLIPVLLMAIKELQNEINELKHEK